MTDVFLSYARGDRARAEQVAKCLHGEGWAVWWDYLLLGGQDFTEAIEDQLKAAPVVLVLWSSESVRSGFVKDEANVAKSRSTLVPVRIDDTDPPLGFRYVHTHSLLDWDGSRESPQFQELARTIMDRLTYGSGQHHPSAEVLDEEPLRHDETSAEPPDVGDMAPDPPPAQEEIDSVAAPDDAPVRLLKGSLEQAESKSSDPGSDPHVLRALVLLADYLRRLGNHAEAIEHYERAMRIAATTSSNAWKDRVRRGLAQSLGEVGRQDEAIEQLTRLKMTSEDSHSLVIRIFQRLEAVCVDEQTPVLERFRAGRTLLGRAEGVLRSYSFEEWQWAPDLTAAVRGAYARALVSLAAIASDLGDHDAAVLLFEEHLLVTTRDAAEWPAALEQLGYEYLATGDERQAPGTDSAHAEALGWYEVAREIFAARGSKVGLREVLRRCSEMALALDDMVAFMRFEAERGALGVQLQPDEEAVEQAVELGWPVIGLDVTSVDPAPVVGDGRLLNVMVRVRNRGSVSCRPGRSIDVDMGTQSSPSSSSSSWWSSSTSRTVTVEERLPPGGVVESPLIELGKVPHQGAEDYEVFVEQAGMPWDGTARVVTRHVPARRT